jgi:hypothetical protein
MLKTAGYLTSTLSVLLLGLVSWKAASHDLLLMACLLLGVAASIMGMVLRWLSYRLEDIARRRKSAPVLRLMEHGHLRRTP